MIQKRIILPNPSDYLNHVMNVIIDSFMEDRPTVSTLSPTPEIAKLLVYQEAPILLDENIQTE